MNAEDVLKYGHRTVMTSIDGLTEAQCLAEGVCGWWSVRHIMAHFSSHELVLNDVLRLFVGDGMDTPMLASYGRNGLAFNDIEVEKRAAMSYADLLREYEQASAVSRDLIAKIPVEKRRQVGAVTWYGPEYDLEDFIAYSNYGHKREHCAQIAVYRDTLK